MTYLPTAEHDELRCRGARARRRADRAARGGDRRQCRVPLGPEGAAGKAGPAGHRLRGTPWRHRAGHPRPDHRGRGDRTSRRHHQPDPHRPEARLAAHHDGRHGRPEGPIHPAPGLRGVADRLCPDRGRRRQRRGQQPDARPPRRRLLRPERVQALHHPRQRGQRADRVRPDRCRRGRPQGDERLRRRDRDARLRGGADRAQDGDPRLTDGRAEFRRRARAGRATGWAPRERASGSP